MRVLIADELGFCFGVRDALTLARAVPDPAVVTIHGELVHNEVVLAELDASGFARSPERGRGIPATEQVLITAHGISERERARLVAAGKTLLDTTCPLVRRAHAQAQSLEQQGCFVVVLGKQGHVEVTGIVEDLARYAIVGGSADIRTWADPAIGIVCQTTVPIRQARELARQIRIQNPHADVRFVDTVCEPTKRRIAAVETLVPRVDAFVVIGGTRSNNTQQLVALARRLGARTLHVQGVEDLDSDWFRGCATVGISAGTSTLDATITAVRLALEAMPVVPSSEEPCARQSPVEVSPAEVSPAEASPVEVKKR